MNEFSEIKPTTEDHLKNYTTQATLKKDAVRTIFHKFPERRKWVLELQRILSGTNPYSSNLT